MFLKIVVDEFVGFCVGFFALFDLFFVCVCWFLELVGFGLLFYVVVLCFHIFDVSECCLSFPQFSGLFMIFGVVFSVIRSGCSGLFFTSALVMFCLFFQNQADTLEAWRRILTHGGDNPKP